MICSDRTASNMVDRYCETGPAVLRIPRWVIFKPAFATAAAVLKLQMSLRSLAGRYLDASRLNRGGRIAYTKVGHCIIARDTVS